MNPVDDFISSAITDAHLASYDPAKLAPAVTSLARWSIENSVPLERSCVFKRSNVAAFIERGVPQLSAGSRGNYRSQLLRIAEALLDESLAPRPLAALAPSDPSVPYTSTEQAALREWARKQNKSRRADAEILVALGLGAGLSAQEITNLRAGDVTACDSGATIVHVTDGRVRGIPVLRRWERLLLRRAGELAPDAYLFIPARTGAGKNLISNFVARGGGVIHVQTQRLRSTWIVTHMAACSPLRELVAAAGVDSLEAFTRYLPFVPLRENGQSTHSLRAAA